ncbi:MAG: hypothetical protein DLM61_12495 [Pseudonocardiales bacterium]|nr:MAG: hypothetical protein DLM61_12495 [Pseudonocardiales bacterium]
MTTETLTVAEARTRREVNSAPYFIRNSAIPASMRHAGRRGQKFEGYHVGEPGFETTMSV